MRRREHIVPNGLLTTVTNCSFPTASVGQADCHSYSHYPVATRRSNAGKRDVSLEDVISSRGAHNQTGSVTCKIRL